MHDTTIPAATRRTRLALALAAGLALAAASCTTTIPIRSTRPGPVVLGATKSLTLVKGEGRRSAREFVTEEMVRQSRQRGYYAVDDHTEDKIFVRLAGGNVEIEDPDHLLGDVGVKIDVLEWGADDSTATETSCGPNGVQTTVEVPVYEGNVLLAVSIFDSQGRVILAEKEYEGHTVVHRDVSRDAVVEQAATQAIANLMQDVTPTEVVTMVQLDDEDPGQEAILATAKAGNVAQAAEDEKAYLASDPNNPSAAYNLAVFLDAMGDYAAAMESYDRALRSGTKSFYVTARADCARRMAAAQTLSAEPAR